jgi:thiol-disulfide isomerase/thioredoxin
VIELEANRPLDAETFALRFPDDVGIFDDGQIVERLEPSPAVQPGDQAPEWRVAGWTDGKSRILSDFRGHVVVLDFWGIWCGPCRRALPVMDRLQEKYRKKGVVVLSIHNAGSKAPEPQRTVDALKIGIPVGIDAGKVTEMSETVARYGVRGFPTYIVIDQNGTVRFNSGIVGDESAAAERLEAAARALEIPWPIDPGLPPDVRSTRFNDLIERFLSDEIEMALKAAEAP